MKTNGKKVQTAAIIDEQSVHVRRDESRDEGVELVISFGEKGADSDKRYEPVAFGRIRKSQPPRP